MAQLRTTLIAYTGSTGGRLKPMKRPTSDLQAW
jgi:hypothetical protein